MKKNQSGNGIDMVLELIERNSKEVINFSFKLKMWIMDNTNYPHFFLL